MIVYRCDVCGQIGDCSQKEIERIEYDVCAECWSALMLKLKDKGRPKARRESLIVPPLVTVPEPSHEREPFPGRPPDIIARSERAN